VKNPQAAQPFPHSYMVERRRKSVRTGSKRGKRWRRSPGRPWRSARGSCMI